MLILGLHNDEDSGVCFMRDGVIQDAVSEERFNRIKLFKGFPERSLEYVLNRHSIELADIDYFAYGWHGRQNNYGHYAAKLVRRVSEAATADPESAAIIADRVRTEFARDARTRALFEGRMSDMGIPSQKITYHDHHQSHAWSAFGCSPYDDAFVVTFDGRGDLKSSSFSVASKSQGIVELDYGLSLDSLGFLYGQITHFLGFTPHRHEGKVTGLSARGNPSATRDIFRSMIDWDGERIVSNIGRFRPFYTKLAGPVRDALGSFSREDIAAGLQAHCEEVVVAYVQYWMSRSKRPEVNKVCLAGGLFANVLINQRIGQIPGIEGVYVFPHMGDGGLPVGSACYQHHLITGQSKFIFSPTEVGPSFDTEEIATVLSGLTDRVTFDAPTDVADAVASDLVQGKVVGFFQGRMEFGPRALGARSILCQARDGATNDWLNQRLRRTEFMPFAPVIPEEHAHDALVGWKPSEVSTLTMTQTFQCTAKFKERHPAVVHIDGTARPQVLSEDRDGIYYRAVAAYCRRSGDWALINTSFNQHEEPIVCTPRDAIESLLQDNVDVVYIGPFRVRAASLSGVCESLS